ncbi:uncharacterized protein LOC114252480 [Bombyx mandarina]|uniref:Uncharacterized protein LOC114252480 n=1 Tax=Bombyx mandarina TaxID=7092 RepID=A0A6J2KMI8_BOMMA|nr:uncharacterized protein LOC114252480 [Bombyx mandarina]
MGSSKLQRCLVVQIRLRNSFPADTYRQNTDDLTCFANIVSYYRSYDIDNYNANIARCIKICSPCISIEVSSERIYYNATVRKLGRVVCRYHARDCDTVIGTFTSSFNVYRSLTKLNSLLHYVAYTHTMIFLIKKQRAYSDTSKEQPGATNIYDSLNDTRIQ